MKACHIIFLCLCVIFRGLAQDNVRTLPIIRVWTVDGVWPKASFAGHPEGCWGDGITNNEFVSGRMRITDGETIIYDSGDEGMRLRIRGNTSAHNLFPPYKVKLGRKSDPMTMGNNHRNWHLMRPWPSWGQSNFLFNNLIGREIGLLVGMKWQPDYRYAELYINDNYRGIYMLSDVVERDEKRVNIDKTEFIAEADAYFWLTDSTRWFRSNEQVSALAYTFKYPEKEDLDADRIGLIHQYFNAMEDALYGGENIEEYINLETFAAWLLAHDILGTKDIGGANMYFCKNEMTLGFPLKSKLELGPLWDFDSNFLVDDSWCGHHNVNYAYCKELLKYEAFVERYVNLANKVLPHICKKVEALTDSISRTFGSNMDDAIIRTNIRRNDDLTSLNDNIRYVTEYFTRRVQWIKDNLATLYDGIHYVNNGITHTPDYSIECIYTLQGTLVNNTNKRGIYIIYRNGKSRKVYID